jgi:hypothetical protein
LVLVLEHPTERKCSMAIGEGRAIGAEDLGSRFGFHPADTDEKREAHEAVRGECLGLAHALVAIVPPGREASLMVTALEEAMMWANAGIARAGGPRSSGA